MVAGFLVVAGVTGSLLAFYEELDVAANPRLHRAEPPAPGARPLDPLTLREAAERAMPGAWVHWVDLAPPEPGRSVVFYAEGPTDPATGELRELADDEVFLDPYTGEELGRRKWGAITQGAENLMPFVYRLHYSLALGTVGTYAFGVVALLWTIDCFVGAYLTFPARRRGKDADRGPRPSWGARWRSAWRVRWRSGWTKLNFDLHRAGGLWTWAMLFVLAWSSVAFNLQEVYRPVTGAVLGMTPEEDGPTLARDQPQPGIPWREALAVARAHMAREAAARGMAVGREVYLYFDPHRGSYGYAAEVGTFAGRPYHAELTFNANGHGALRRFLAPPDERAGDAVTRWLYDLHMARVFGLPFRVLVCAMGLVVTALSITGVIVWWKKRRARLLVRARRKRSPGVAAAEPGLAAARPRNA